MGTSRGIAVAAAIVLGACAPTVDGPREQQRAIDREDAALVGAQLARLPGAVSASVTIHRPAVDPLALVPGPAATAAALIVVDDLADRAQLADAATALVRAAAPEVAAPSILTLVGAHRPSLASVGPFTVEASSRAGLKAALVGALAVIASLAAWITVRERQRRGNSAQ